MSWLEAAFGIGDEAEPDAPPVRSRRLAPEVKSFWCVVAQPSGAPGDLGQAVAAHYFVEDGVLTMCDQDGKAGETSRTLAPGDDPRAVAGRLRRDAWSRENGNSAFNRPLHYRSFGLT